ncbi:hypothetical protein GFL91_36770 [Rhizobium leguminosarum bv. viciae]|jgi:hypothetical protein|uniref:Transglutaminase-like domain-containing protein n=1 Tax=Rhizobium leguminosarum bv. viciae TaxID=387 RepID=A0A8I2GZK0_RHILV|nr:hypothetical protein [Rhizobium leguminosarum]MBY5790048.1 hypothetical protein [Rhizobium leguminosarum]NKM50358.1 hypothetical protein [Rhizobium leguminosarum bv. viciae]
MVQSRNVAGISICLGAALLVGVAVQNYNTSTKLSKLRAENKRINEQLTQVSESLKQLGSLPLAFAETPEGLKLVPAEDGVSKDDLDFVKRFRGPLLDLNTDLRNLSVDQLKQLLRTRLLTEFEGDPRNLSLAETKRRAMITFAMLRVNGSMPTYEVRDSVPDDFKTMLLGTSGNCADFTIRVMLVAEALGLKAALISANTPALPGHVFADVYDPEEDTAYMLDSNFDVQIAREHTAGKGFFEALLTSGAEEQDNFSLWAKVKVLPVYFRYVDPGEKGLYGTPLTAGYINQSRSKREDTWRNWTSKDLANLVDWWKRIPNHRPRTLAEFRQFLSNIPTQFNSSGDYAARLRKAAGVDLTAVDMTAQMK